MAPMFEITADEALDCPLVLAGTVEEICDVLIERRERYGFTYWVMSGEAMKDFAPVVGRLTGT